MQFDKVTIARIFVDKLVQVSQWGFGLASRRKENSFVGACRASEKMGLDAVDVGHLRVINDFLDGIYKSRLENSA